MTFKQRIIDGATAAAASRGYELIPAWHVEGLPLANHLSTLFARQGIDCVLDVGANQGQFHDFLRDRVGFEGQILSFEPVSKYVALLTERAKADPRWAVHGHALGSGKATAEINVTESPGLNSFLEPRRDQVAGFWGEQRIAKETVAIERLDDVFESLRSRHGFSAPYLKLDTQGFDLQVIAGATQSLHHVRALQTEASIRPIYASMPDYRQTIDTMGAHGFDVSGIFPVTHDDDLRLIEFDCVMVRVVPTTR